MKHFRHCKYASRQAGRFSRRRTPAVASALAAALAVVPMIQGRAAAAGPTSTTTAVIARAPGAHKPADVATFGTQTASASQPDGRGYYDFGSGPGGQIVDHLAVRNYSLQAITVSLKATDAVNTPQGGLAALPVNESPRDVGIWIQLPGDDLTLTIPARHYVIVPFRVEVPRTATPGDHVGAITATLQSSIISKSGQKVRLLQTAGSRVFLRVSGPLRPGLAVAGLSVRYQGTWNPAGKGRAIIAYSVRNTGNVGLGGKQTVYVSGLFGSKKTAVLVRDVQLLLPGYSVRQRISIAGIIPEVRDTAHVSVSPLYIPGSVQPASGPFTASVSFWAVPWPDLLIIVGLLLVIVALLDRRRRGRRSPKRPGPHKPGEPSESSSEDDPPLPAEAEQPAEAESRRVGVSGADIADITSPTQPNQPGVVGGGAGLGKTEEQVR